MKRTLIVDDQPDILEALRLILESDGYEVQSAQSGKCAWDRLCREGFDLMVTDFDMPEMKGDELARRTKERWPKTPVLMLSGSAETLRGSDRKLHGVDALVSKPFLLEEFRDQVARLIERGPRTPDESAEQAFPIE
jgi:CheY-like chemotaxis protein